MSFFSSKQTKILLVVWSIFLLVLYGAFVLMGSVSAALLAFPFVIVPMQVTNIAYLVLGVPALLIWLLDYRHQHTARDYALIMIIFAVIFTYLLRYTF